MFRLLSMVAPWAVIAGADMVITKNTAVSGALFFVGVTFAWWFRGDRDAIVTGLKSLEKEVHDGFNEVDKRFKSMCKRLSEIQGESGGDEQ